MYSNRKFNPLLAMLCCLLVSALTLAQTPSKTIATSISGTIIRIGEQVVLTLNVPLAKGQKIKITNYADTLNAHISVARPAMLDTVTTGSTDTLHVKYYLTSFDSGYWPIPPIPLVINNDTLYSDVKLLTVSTIAVDTTQDIKAIKPPMDAPFSFKELIPYIVVAWIIAILVTLGVVLYRKYKNKHKIPPAPETLLTPYEWAMLQFTNIDAQQLWQQGFAKEYHSGIADTLREYLYKEFKFNALEQTTAQTKRSIKHITAINHDNKRKLIDVLELADMVKFAKETPLQDEHEASLRYAQTFVEGVAKALTSERGEDVKPITE